MAVSEALGQQLFKYNFTGNTFVCDCAINKPEIAGKVFELMSRDKKKPGESDYMQFKRLYEIMTKEIARQTKAQVQVDDMERWKQEYKAQYKNPITPERIKAMLDEQLDKGEISEKQHEFGYKGLRWMWDFEPEQVEADNDIPF